MKKFVITLVIALCCTSAFATIQCLNISFDNCVTAWTGSEQLRWAVRCPFADGNNRLIDGPFACVAQSGTIGDANGYLYRPSTTWDNNKYCWCKLNYPTVSQWVFAGEYSSASACMGGCNSMCSNAFVNNSVFRTSIITNLKNYGA